MKLGLSPGLGLVSPSKASLLKTKIADQGPAELAKRVTRSSLATCIGSDGTVQWGPHNLAAESNSLTNWSSSLTANSTPFSVAAFDGGMYGITANSISGTTNFNALFTANDTKMCLFVDVKRGNFDTGNGCYSYGFYNATLAADIAYVQVNYLTGAVDLTGPQAATATAYTTTLANGWFRIGIKVTAGVNPGNNVYAYLAGVGSPTSAGFYWYMARVHVLNGDKTAYVDSTVGNRLGYSNDFTNAVWTKTAITIQQNVVVMPNGVPMHALVETAASSTHTLLQQITKSSSSSQWCESVYLKAGTRTWAAVQYADFNGYSYAYINLLTGAVGANGATLGSPVLSVVAIGNGVWRVSVSGISASTNGQFTVYVANGDGGGNYAGDGISYILASSAQLNPGASAATYVYNPFAAPTVGPIYSGRTDYDPVTLASKGTLIEEQRTQLLANPDDLSISPWSGNPVVTNDGTKYRGRTFWKVAKTTTAGSENWATTGVGGAQAIGYYTQRIALLASSNSNQIQVGLLGGTSTWGNNADTTGYIESGPGNLAQSVGGLWTMTSMSTSVPMVIVLTRNLLVSETIGLFIYPDASSSTTIGRANYVQCDNLEPGKSPTSYIPNPSTSAATRTADTALVGFDNLAQVWPWVMDANLLVSPEALDNASWVKPILTVSPNALTAPDGTQTMDKLIPPTSSGEQYLEQNITPAAGTWTLFCKAVVPAGYNWVVVKPIHVGDTGDTSEIRYNMVTGAWNIASKNRITTYGASQNSDGSWFVYATFTTTASCTSLRGRINLSVDGTTTVFAGDGVSGIGVWGVKLNPGPIAQTYYPNSVKQATIVVEGDLTYGATSGVTALCSLANPSGDIDQLFKPASSNSLYGYANPSSMGPIGTLTSGVAFKAALGVSPPNAGAVFNGSTESAISSASAFPTRTSGVNRLLLGTNASGNVASAMHIKRLRLLTSNLTAAGKQVVT